MTNSSPNTCFKPLSFKIEPVYNKASIGNIEFDRLVREYGTPIYILDELTIRESVKAYKNAFRQYPAETELFYAAKANCCMGLCAMFKQDNVGLDVVSVGEYYTAMQSGFPLDKIIFNGNNKTEEELKLIISNGIGKISVDNFYELELIHKIASQKVKKIDILLRITPGIECHTHHYIKTGHLDSKFGFDLTLLDEAVELINSCYKNTINLTGLHAHIGSQIFEIQPYVDLIEVMLNLYNDIKKRYGTKLTHIDIGGGLGIAYQETDNPISVFDFADAIIDKLVTYAKNIDFPLPVLILEPGRSLIATAGVTLYTVGSIKTIPEISKTYVAVDGGMGDNIRPALYNACYKAKVVNKIQEPHTRQVTIAGRYCESGDILIHNCKVPDSIEPGDLLLVFDTGAYNYSMFSNYNRVPRPPMILVNEGNSYIMVQKQTMNDLISHDLIPETLLSSFYDRIH